MFWTIGLQIIAIILQSLICVRSDFERLELNLVLVKDFPVESPGLLNLFYKTNKDRKEFSLISSSFSNMINSKDNAFYIENVGNANETTVKAFQTTFNHPKDISLVPSKAFDFPAVSIPDGDPVVGKGDGRVLLVDMTDINFQKFYDLTSGRVPSKKFYHYGRVIWTDLGGVWNKQHFIVCRWASGQELLSQLVFFERPVLGDELSKPWGEIILMEGACDSNLAELHVKQKKENWEVLYATGKVTKSLNFFWPETPKGGLGWWNDPTQIKGRILDKGREFYDVRVEDVNNDNLPDVVVTVQGDRTNKNGTLEIWEIDPVSFRNVEGYKRHVIAHGFAPKTTGSEARSPGAVKVFHPTKDLSIKPWILLAGEDDGKAYYFIPKSEDKLNWDYEKREIPLFNTTPVTGVDADDVDGDGFADIFVSLHGIDTVKMFSFKPIPVTKPTTTGTTGTTVKLTTPQTFKSTTSKVTNSQKHTTGR